MAISLTVGKLDAGLAILLTQDRRLIEFPSILLPPNLTAGSIVDITVSHNHKAEYAASQAFQSLQSEIFETFGRRSAKAPVLRLRNATQTSVVLEWDNLELETSRLVRGGLSLWRNGSKAGNIPKPLSQTSTKISGLSVDSEYTFHLLLTTTAGTYSSNILKTKTHKLTDLSGITITPGILPTELLGGLTKAVDRIGGKMIDSVRIDTTHFVTTEGKGDAWDRACEMNIPVVRPEWVEGCEREGRLVGVRGYYLGADPRQRTIGPGFGARPPSSRGETQVGSRPAIQGRGLSQVQQGQPPTPNSAGLNSITSPKMVNEPGTPQKKVELPTHVKQRPPIHDFTEELKDDSYTAQDVAPPTPPLKGEHRELRETNPTSSAENEKGDEALEVSARPSAKQSIDVVENGDQDEHDVESKGESESGSLVVPKQENGSTSASEVRRTDAGDADTVAPKRDPSQGSFQEVAL